MRHLHFPLPLTAAAVICALTFGAAGASAATGPTVPMLSTVIGNGSGSSYTGDGGPGTDAGVNDLQGVAVAPDSSIAPGGSVYIADAANNAVRMLAAADGTFYGQQMTAGDIYTVVGSSTYTPLGPGGLRCNPGGNTGFSGDGGPAQDAALDNPLGVSVDANGNLYIVDSCNYRIRMVPAANGTFFGQSMTAGDIYTVAGDGTDADSGDGGPATHAAFGESETVAVSPSGDLYIGDFEFNCVRKVTAADDTISTFGPVIPDALGLGFDQAGNLYVASPDSNRVFRVAPDGAGTVIAGGNGTPGYSGDGGPASSALLNAPHGLAVASDGTVYFSDRGNDRIRAISPTGTISTYAGDGAAGFAGDGGPASAGQVNFVESLATSPTGAVYFTDTENNRVREISPPSPPALTGMTATATSASTATLAGDVNPYGAEGTYFFQYGTSTSYGQSTALADAGAGTSAQAISAPVSGLQPGTPYHYRLVAFNSGGTSTGPDETFWTAPAASISCPAGWSDEPVTCTVTAQGASTLAYQMESAPGSGSFGAWQPIANGGSFTYQTDGRSVVQAQATGSDGQLSALAQSSAAYDNTAPTVSLSAPASATAGTVTLTVTASDSLSGVAGVVVQSSADGGASWSVACTANGNSCAWAATPGSFLLRAVATDNAANTAVSPAQSVTITAPPTPTPPPPTPPPTPPAPTVTLTSAPPATSQLTATDITYRETGTVTVTACTLDARPVSCNATSATLTGLGAGSHTFIVAVSGPGGSASAHAQFAVTVPAPVISAHARKVGTSGHHYLLDASATQPGRGRVTSWRWSLSGKLIARSARVTVTLPAGASRRYELTVTNSAGASATKFLTVKASR
jgi:hypothetical protein